MEQGDFVVYFVSGKPQIGKYTRTRYNTRLVIMPQKKQNSICVLRNRSQVISINDLVKKYGPLLKGQTR